MKGLKGELAAKIITSEKTMSTAMSGIIHQLLFLIKNRKR